ncbi:MAG: cohesin domain-containing protein [Clostridium sp.]|uniref:cohesin domain-containing protein n=1 Tax=Clostridium sp. TaxID=1506 RepID=UPI00290835AC|nr:cohesin domain-containing protein [Clostridium sp.]MDU4937971.1 cohesin domain-containing protein [Clostridium sp.]
MKFYSKKLKKFLAMICAFCLIVEFSLSGIPVKAAEPTPKITYTITGEATVDKQITISLNVSNISGLYGGSWDFAYDPSILKIDEITSGELTSSIPQITTSNKSGHAYFWFTKTGDTAGVNTTEAKSIAKIRATVLKEGTVNLTTTNDDNAFGLNSKTSLVKLSLAGGSKLDYTSTDKSISCTKPNVVLRPGSYEENHSAINYNGTWENNSNPSHSSGSAKLSTTASDSIEFFFNGTGFQWYSNLNIYRGYANIYIDGNLVKSLDTYSNIDKFNSSVFSIYNLENKLHHVKIQVANKKHPDAANNRIAIDRIVIMNTSDYTIINQGLYDETSSSLKYTGYWENNTNPLHNSGNVLLSTATNNSVEFMFSGTGFDWYSNLNKYRGYANIYIDGNLIAAVDTYSLTDKYNSLVYSIRNLENTVHHIKIEASGKSNINSSNNRIAIDSIIIY